MKKVIFLLLITLALNLSTRVWPGNFYRTLSSARQSAIPLFLRGCSFPSTKLSPSLINATKSYGTKTSIFLPRTHRFMPSRNFVQAPSFIAKGASTSAKWAGGALLGGVFGSVLAEEDAKNQKNSEEGEARDLWDQLSSWFEEVLKEDDVKKFKDNLLLEAVDLKDISKLREAIKAGANVDAQDTYGWTALMKATESSVVSIEIVRELIKNGANVNASNKYGSSPLANLNPDSKDSLDVLKELINAGADINFQDKFYKTTKLMRSVGDWNPSARRLEFSKELLKLGADVNLQDMNGQTALMRAVVMHNVEMVKELLNVEGIKLNIVDNSRRSALNYALGSENPEIIRLFKAKMS